ncbi:SDR family NAD(P)-dependent oxidoreductase [Nocardioides lianchengensis]|uniref:NADP-dependent 3-hydroxy acid dehydrogenase YdfG n=1 Tax=Nocardioides lianchengensis TaxID=1045774 RepID=A0A1G6LX35_9ACTN|nr:SDR family NAD(P)-dependent oxidoreductase [Nocardioides lianchengensis]NYG12419.1 NAD(P)-dependent dehydrogenase (short-subunit alcohol dehydrogenase family) [Nocardioides lianchengensis]SDC47769.1 NADP-dependent 3-hydroxy acid dehydrogenase YdfG [Nocardioides lianchengensis]
MAITDLLDAALDRSVVLGYTSLGSRLRRRWWPADPAPGSLAGKRVLVTGATSGIGEAMAGSFARLGATVHVLGRNADKLAGVARELRLEHPNATIVEEVCDVGDLDAVRDWGEAFADRVPGLDGLVHNAGTMTDTRTESPQGHELQLAVHVLGPHLMTELLLPALTAARGIVVWMSTGGMYGAALPDGEDAIEYRDGTYRGVSAYARTKRMQVVLADAWARRYDGTDVRVESMHPGWVETPGVATHLPRFRSLTRPLLRTAEDGADTAVWLVATRPPSEPGHLWHDRAQRPTTFGWQRDQDPAAVARFLDYVAISTETPPDWD